MKFLVISLAILAVAVAQKVNEPLQITRYLSETSPLGSYRYAFDTENGIHVDQEGSLKPGKDGESLNVKGSFTYMSDDGQVYNVNYVADENGFRPIGGHLPSAP